MLPFNIGPGELILILVIGLVVLGPGKLPDVASSLGKSLREFRKAATDVTEAGRFDATPTTSPAAPTTSPAAPATPATPPPPAAARAPAGAPEVEPSDDTAVAAGVAAAPARDADDS